MVFLCISHIFAHPRFHTIRQSLSLFGAIGFALHPVQAESVTYISGRADVLCGSFYILSFLAYMRATSFCSFGCSETRWLWFSVATICLCGAGLSKEVGLVAPVLWIVYDLLFGVLSRLLMSNGVRSPGEFFYQQHVNLRLLVASILLFGFGFHAVWIRSPPYTGKDGKSISFGLISQNVTSLKAYFTFTRLAENFARAGLVTVSDS
jgi:hypothetical protein